MSPNDYVSFKVSGTSHVLVCRILQKEHFPTFAAMLAAKGIVNLLPGKNDLIDGVRLYHSFSNRKGISYDVLEKENGVVALTVQFLGA